MGEKRFRILGIEQGTHSYVWDSEKRHRDGVGDELWVGEVVGLLNYLYEENKELKQQLDKIPKNIKEIWLNG